MARRYRRVARKSAPKRRKLQTVGRKRNAMTALGAISTGAKYGIKAAEWYKKLKTSTKRNVDAEQSHQTTADYKYSSRKYGRKLTTNVRSKRLVNQDQRIDKFNIVNYTAWGTGYGANYLQSIQPGLPGTEIELPCHLYDLTAVPQARQTGAASYLREVYFPATRYDLYMSSETAAANVVWKYWLNNNNTASATADSDPATVSVSKEKNFFPIYSSSTGYVPGQSTVNESYGLGDKSFLESFSAKMLFYSTRAHCTKFRVSLIQLKEDVSPDQSSVLATSFWQAMMKEYAYNPIEKGNYALINKYSKVLKSMTFILDSPTSSDADQQARTREVDFKGFINKRLNYRWGRITDTVHMFEEGTFENAEVPFNPFAFHPHPNARVYLMIQAMVPRVAPNAPLGALNTSASYDMNLTTTHRNLTT